MFCFLEELNVLIFKCIFFNKVFILYIVSLFIVCILVIMGVFIGIVLLIVGDIIKIIIGYFIGLFLYYGFENMDLIIW